MNKQGLSLISGGIDSPVSSYLMTRQGYALTGVHFENFPYAEPWVEKRALELAKKAGLKHAFVVKNAVNLDAYARECNPRFLCIIDRRMMFRVCAALAEKEQASFVVTGESLAQVASQTLQNLYVENTASRLPVVRPLIGMDKEEIIKIARKLGTFERSVAESSCGFIPHKPATGAWLREIEQEESKLDVDKIVQKTVASAKRVKL